MNKYQEALSNLEDIICELSCELKQDYELYTRETGYEKYSYILQELVDILKEYNVTQSNIRKILLAGNQFEHLIDKANKYDEKETPKKVNLKTRYPVCDFDGDGDLAYDCPKCGSGYVTRYCQYCLTCGQKLDWGDE